jgi:hypothetical protein
MFIKQFGIDVGENWVKTQCVQPKMVITSTIFANDEM